VSSSAAVLIRVAKTSVYDAVLGPVLLTLIIKKRFKRAKKNLCLELLGFAGIFEVRGDCGGI
jgi:hypothetical protein